MQPGTPEFSRTDIDEAGRILMRVPGEGEIDSEWLEAAHLVNRWRAAHAHPLNVFRTNLRRRADKRALVAQRLKRLPSIIAKLQRIRRLELSEMQDIGGCRVVLDSPRDAFNLAEGLASSSIRHELLDHDDYIRRPRKTGYRGIHLMYAYNSDSPTRWQGLKTEIQLRSQLQHQWATAVETVGTFIGEELKSGAGNPTWLRFFALMSTIIAQQEKAPNVPGTPSDRSELVRELLECDRELDIVENLAGFQKVTSRLRGFRGRNHWIVIELDLETGRVSGKAFRANDWESANTLYLNKEVELRGSPREVVLVSTDSLAALRKTYPNYFLDLSKFRSVVRETVANP